MLGCPIEIISASLIIRLLFSPTFSPLINVRFVLKLVRLTQRWFTRKWLQDVMEALRCRSWTANGELISYWQNTKSRNKSVKCGIFEFSFYKLCKLSLRSLMPSGSEAEILDDLMKLFPDNVWGIWCILPREKGGESGRRSPHRRHEPSLPRRRRCGDSRPHTPASGGADSGTVQSVFSSTAEHLRKLYDDTLMRQTCYTKISIRSV